MKWVEARDLATGEIVLKRVRYCSSFLCRLRGLTFRRRLQDDEGLLLVGDREGRAAAAIHMMFVFFPIGVAWLGEDGHVVDTRLAHPFRVVCVPSRPARNVLEGPPLLLERVYTGQQLTFSGAVRG